MSHCRCIILAVVGLATVGAEHCDGESCADAPVGGNELLQTRREDRLSERQKWMHIREKGQQVNVRCAPDCRGHEEFTLTLASPTVGDKVFLMKRNNNIFSEHFHIQIDMPDGSIKRKKMPKHQMECHYMGEGIALTTCEELSGHFFLHDTYVRLWQKDNGDLILGGKEEIPARFHSKSDAPAFLELDEYEDLTEEGTCGDGIIGDGEECDGGKCCTSSCKFASAGERCAPQLDSCSTGGTCTGASAMCSMDIVRNGVSCANNGICFEGSCTSREYQCERAGFSEGPCNKTTCETLHCVLEGKCISVGDTIVEPGTPCLDSSQVCLQSGCGDVSAYKTEKKVVSDILVAESAQVSDEEAEAAYMMNPGPAKETMVVLPTSAQQGWSAAKCAEYMNYVNAGIHYSTQGMQGFSFQLHRYIAHNQRDFDGFRLHTDYFKMRDKGNWYVNAGRWPRDAHATAVLTDEGCQGGVMWTHKLCTDWGWGFMGIGRRGQSTVCDYGFNTNRWGFDVVAHEMGHSIGMSDLVNEKAGHNNAGPTWMGMKAPNSGKKYNPFSVQEWKQYFPTSQNVCRTRRGGALKGNSSSSKSSSFGKDGKDGGDKPEPPKNSPDGK